MHEHEWLAEQFEGQRAHLRAVAYRMLGSLSEAEDAVQESWLRLSRADTRGVENMGGWLTTIVARVCLDMLRSRAARREESLDARPVAPRARDERGDDPEQEALLADAVGLALLVVLQTLAPAERLAFVLHDVFAVPFEEIAPIVDRSPTATRQLASRARRRIRGAPAVAAPVLHDQRAVVEAFLAASRAGDFEALLAALDPDVVFRADRAAVALGGPGKLQGATAVAKFFRRNAQAARPALIDGALGVVVAPLGRLLLILHVRLHQGKIAAIEAIADPDRLRQLDLAVLDG